MTSGEMGSVLEECINKLSENTAHPENFLSPQSDVAADFTSLTKTLYDLHKAQAPAGVKGSPLVQLVVEEFDDEQIWQELELQNSAVLKHFRRLVAEALSDDGEIVLDDDRGDEDVSIEGMEEEEEEEEEEKTCDGQTVEDDEAEEKLPKQSKPEVDMEDDTDADSDLDFDVDALEKREECRKQDKKAKGSKSKVDKVEPSEVDDRFFKLSEMETFLDDMDRKDGKNEGEEDVDYFMDLPSDDDGDFDLEEAISSKKQKKGVMTKSSRNLKYKDYFDAEGSEPAEADEQSVEDSGHSDAADDEEDYDEEEEEDDDNEAISAGGESVPSKVSQKKVTFNLSGGEESDSDGEEVGEILGRKTVSPAESKSPFEKRQDKMAQKISELEAAALAEKPWQLSGEASAQARPENSLLEEDVEFEQASRMAPAITEQTTLQLEDIIKQRIKDQTFDDVVRKEKPKEDVFEYKKRLTLDHEKSKHSLAEIYEQEYQKQSQQKTEEEENPAHVEIQKLMDTLFLKLDALSNFHFTPKPPVPEVKVVSNLPSIAMEEVAPVSASDATLLAPEEVKEKSKGGDVLGDTEKTSTDKKRERRRKKQLKRIKNKEIERRVKLKEASKVGDNKKPTKAEVTASMKKLTKGGRATLLKDEGKDKALRSSQAFFSKLQDQVRSEVKGAKQQQSKKKKLKEVSASKLKL